jgi:hypothetical protein
VGSFQQTLVESWDGTAWSVTPSLDPGAADNTLYGVSCTGVGSCVSVGASYPFGSPSGPNTTLVESWDGTSWSVTPSLDPDATNNELLGVSCTTSCLAVGVQGGEFSAFYLTETVPDPFSIATTSLPGGTVGQAYSTTLLGTGGNPSYRWSLSSGSLPTGLHLTRTGVIKGKPKGSETSTFTVTAVDTKTKATRGHPSTQNTASRTLSITVTQPTPVITLVHPNSGPITGGTKVTITGTSLWAPSSVLFGGYPATAVTANAAGTKITAYSPAEGAGTVDIVVTTPGGANVPGTTDDFTYP